MDLRRSENRGGEERQRKRMMVIIKAKIQFIQSNICNSNFTVAVQDIELSVVAGKCFENCAESMKCVHFVYINSHMEMMRDEKENVWFYIDGYIFVDFFNLLNMAQNANAQILHNFLVYLGLVIFIWPIKSTVLIHCYERSTGVASFGA